MLRALPSLHSCFPKQEAWSSRVSRGHTDKEVPKSQSQQDWMRSLTATSIGLSSVTVVRLWVQFIQEQDWPILEIHCWWAITTRNEQDNTMKMMEELLMVTETAMVRGCLKTATMSAPAPSSPTESLMPATDTTSLTRRLTTWEAEPPSLKWSPYRTARSPERLRGWRRTSRLLTIS